MTKNKAPSIPTCTISRNPATNQILGSFAVTPPEALPQIVREAAKAQQIWAEVPVRRRVRHLLRVRDYLVEYAEALAEAISSDNGKTRVDAMATEVMPAVMATGYYARKARRLLREQWLPPGHILLFNKWSKLRRVPFGVIGIISPWNYPFGIPFSEVVMALLAGNAVVLKVATETQVVGGAIERCFAAADLPEGLFHHVNLPGSAAGKAMLESGVNKLFFTGSVAVGKQLMAEAARTLTPVVLELGGNDAMLVAADADLERASAGAVWAGIQNCGQSCAAVERIYVHEKVYEPFLALLKGKVEALRVGPDRDFGVDLGVMTTNRQCEKVKEQIQDALARGAVIHAQSAAPDPACCPNALPAIVLTQVDHTMRVMREETFGPVLAVMPVADMELAVALANDSSLGLTGSVWSRNMRYAHRLARRIRAGVVTINDHMISHGMAEVPWGGFGESGIGRTHGAVGFHEMTQTQATVHDLLWFARRNLWWYPHGRPIFEGLLGGLQALYGKAPRARIGGMRKLLRIIPRIFRVDSR